LLRTKQDQIKKKRVQDFKSITSLPPKGAPNWCLNREALIKLNRSTENIPVYDYETGDISSSSHDTDNETNSNTKKRKEKKKPKRKDKKYKKSKK
jgi:hypothetical protein